jgi:hypothetical protein
VRRETDGEGAILPAYRAARPDDVGNSASLVLDEMVRRTRSTIRVRTAPAKKRAPARGKGKRTS